MKAGDTHERWHPGESDDYLRAAIARVNGGDMSGLRDEVLRTVKWGGRDPEGAANRILSLLAERLTSDEAVQAMKQCVDRDPTATAPEGLSLTALGARDAITAALIAAGIQKGEDDR